MTDVDAILAQLRSNKKKPANHAGCTRRISVKKRKPRQKKYWSKPIGKFVGYCPHCMIEVGESEVTKGDFGVDECCIHLCTRCGADLWLEDLPHGMDYETLRDWRRHDKWGNTTMPVNQSRAEHFMGMNILRKLSVDNHNRRPQA